MTTIQLHIDGTNLAAQNRRTFERRNPISNQIASTAAAASPQDALMAVEAASKAFAAWSTTGPGERRALLNKAADELQAAAPRFIQSVIEETGASSLWAGFNLMTAVGILWEAAAITTQIAGQVIPSDLPGNISMALRQPAGVVLGIAPWNAPGILGMRAIAVPLACGNTVILKGSEFCPATHRMIVDAFERAGFPPGVVNFIAHAPEDAGAVVAAMVAHKAVRRVNFTGSTKVGKIIALLCAEHLKPALLELGGKAPFLVLDDADIDQAVGAAVFGAFMHSGQICMSTERLIVDEAVAGEFATRLAARAQLLLPGTGDSPIASVIDMATVHRCNALIDDALTKGATLLCGGKASNTMMAPTLLDHVTPDMAIYREESFGPVKGIVRDKGEGEAVRCANDNDYGLSAAVFSRDTARALRVAQRIESGICHINGPTLHDEPQMHFGGVKHSGIGHFGGQSGIDAFTDLRSVSLQTSPRHYPF